MNQLNATYWENRYKNQQTGWDIGYPSTPIKEYLDSIDDKSSKILIPGAGNAYEAEYAHTVGFKNVHVLDYALDAIENFKERVSFFPEDHLHHTDFFTHVGAYDIILEQTFFCALNPSLREMYAIHCHNLLKPNGLLIGLLWDAPMNADHPPFGGSQSEYRELFQSHFQLEMSPAHNSIAPRQGREIFIRFKKK